MHILVDLHEQLVPECRDFVDRVVDLILKKWLFPCKRRLEDLRSLQKTVRPRKPAPRGMVQAGFGWLLASVARFEGRRKMAQAPPLVRFVLRVSKN